MLRTVLMSQSLNFVMSPVTPWPRWGFNVIGAYQSMNFAMEGYHLVKTLTSGRTTIHYVQTNLTKAMWKNLRKGWIQQFQENGIGTRESMAHQDKLCLSSVVILKLRLVFSVRNAFPGLTGVTGLRPRVAPSTPTMMSSARTTHSGRTQHAISRTGTPNT